MKKTMITMMVAAMTAMGGLAYADMSVPVYEKAPTMEKPLVGTVSFGYSSNYVSRGLVLSNASNDNAFTLPVTGEYALSDQYSIVGGIKYTMLETNGFTHCRGGGVSDEANGILGIRRDWGKGLTTTLGYQYVNGGLIDVFYPGKSGGSGRELFNSTKAEEHSVVFDINYDLSEVAFKGLFWDSRIQYAAKWMSGWWFTNTLGYKYDMCPAASVILSATWNVSAGYFDANSMNANGTQGVSLNLEIPVKICDCVVVKPFISTVWAGNGAITANRRHGEMGHMMMTHHGNVLDPGNVYRNFNVVAGAAVTYTF